MTLSEMTALIEDLKEIVRRLQHENIYDSIKGRLRPIGPRLGDSQLG